MNGCPEYQSGSTPRIFTSDGATIGAPVGIVASTPWSVRSQLVTCGRGLTSPPLLVDGFDRLDPPPVDPPAVLSELDEDVELMPGIAFWVAVPFTTLVIVSPLIAASTRIAPPARTANASGRFAIAPPFSWRCGGIPRPAGNRR